MPIQDDGWYEENGVDLRLSTVVSSLDREGQIVELDDGEELFYDACVIATGSEPIRLFAGMTGGERGYDGGESPT